MGKYNYNQIVKVAKNCQEVVKKEKKLGITSKWAYFFAKAITEPQKAYNQFNYPQSPNPTGDYLSRQIVKKDYLDCCKRLVKYVELNKRMPNYVAWKNFKIHPSLFTEVMSRVLIYYDTHKELPKYANINSKVFKEETETGNKVYNLFVKKTGKKFTTIDDLLRYMQGRVYGYYYDDKYSNEEVINRIINRQGVNCTDSLQFLINMAEAMGYEWKCLHIKCKGGDGHVRGQFRHKKHTGNQWINRDPASVLNGGAVSSIWCSNGSLIATNPNWFLANLRR